MGTIVALSDRRFPRRLTVDIDEEMYRRLRVATAADDISVAHRTRALLALWSEDPTIRSAVDELAAQMKSQGREGTQAS